MVEIYNKLRVPGIEKKEIEITKNPPSIFGCTVSDCHRLIQISPGSEHSVYVDFIAHQPLVNEWVFVPARHILYLPATDMDAYCINIPHYCLDDIQQVYFLGRIYQKSKTINLEVPDPDHFELNKLFRSGPSLSRTWPSLQYVHKARELIDILTRTEIDFRVNITDLAARLHMSTKTLCRISKSVFNHSPYHILRYYLQLKIIFRTITCKLNTFFEIADDLKCSDVSSFGRYVKSLSGSTPGAIRAQFSQVHP